MSSLTLILAASIGIHAGHGGAREDCRECGGTDVVVRKKIEKLRTSCLGIVRRKAARELREYDWRRHPEAVEALAVAVASDRQCLVRREAAESLGKMKPRLAVAREALALAAADDSSLIARRAARRALKAVDEEREEPRDVYGPDPFERDEFPPLRPESGELIVPPFPESLPEPLAPTSTSVPVTPGAMSPFAPEATSQPPPRRVQRPMVHPEDSTPLVAPVAPIDRYAPFSGPPPTPIDIPAPPPGWPG